MIDAMLFLQTDDEDLPAQMMKGMTEVQLYLHQMVQTSQVRAHSSSDILYHLLTVHSSASGQGYTEASC